MIHLNIVEKNNTVEIDRNEIWTYDIDLTPDIEMLIDSIVNAIDNTDIVRLTIDEPTYCNCGNDLNQTGVCHVCGYTLGHID